MIHINVIAACKISRWCKSILPFRHINHDWISLTFGSTKLAPNSYCAVGILMVSVDWEGISVGPMTTLKKFIKPSLSTLECKETQERWWHIKTKVNEANKSNKYLWLRKNFGLSALLNSKRIPSKSSGFKATVASTKDFIMSIIITFGQLWTISLSAPQTLAMYPKYN